MLLTDACKLTSPCGIQNGANMIVDRVKPKVGDLVKRWSMEPVGRRRVGAVGLVIDSRPMRRRLLHTTMGAPFQEVLVSYAPGDDEWVYEGMLDVIHDSN